MKVAVKAPVAQKALPRRESPESCAKLFMSSTKNRRTSSHTYRVVSHFSQVYCSVDVALDLTRYTLNWYIIVEMQCHTT